MFKYIAGNKQYKLLNNCKNVLKKNKYPIVNFIVENNRYSKHKVANEYLKLLDNIDSNYKIALKLSSLDFDINLITSLIDKYKSQNISVIIDAEDNINYQKYNNITNDLTYNYNKNSFTVFKTYQLYRKDALQELSSNINFHKKHDLYFASKLVRGAYYNTEKNGTHLFKKKNILILVIIMLFLNVFNIIKVTTLLLLTIKILLN